jgi:3-methyladenine DNA glycosylase AlkD
MHFKEIIKKLESLKNPKNVDGMARFGIRPKTKVYGVPVPELRKIAKIIKKDHELALKLWDLKIHEARILSGMIADPEKMTDMQIKKWVSDFDSWDVCDQACMNLLNKSKIAKNHIFKFSESKEEFIKRTAFALMAALAVHDKKAEDEDFIKFFPLIKKAATDERNFVRKAVNWALRQIGKRNKSLNVRAIKLAKEILKFESKSARWIANDAIRELTSEKIKIKL